MLRRKVALGDCEKAGQAIGVSTMTAWRLFKALEFDGVIERITKGAKATKRASEWKFIGNKEEQNQ